VCESARLVHQVGGRKYCMGVGEGVEVGNVCIQTYTYMQTKHVYMISNVNTYVHANTNIESQTRL